MDDLADHDLSGAMRAAVWPARSISHPRRAHRGIARRPPFRGRPGHVEMFSRPRDRPTLIDDTTREQQAPARSQNSISVDHEGLLIVAVKW